MIAPKNTGKQWTREDIKSLRQLAREVNVPTKEIARRLGRSATAVRSEAHREDISRRPKNR